MPTQTQNTTQDLGQSGENQPGENTHPAPSEQSSKSNKKPAAQSKTQSKKAAPLDAKVRAALEALLMTTDRPLKAQTIIDTLAVLNDSPNKPSGEITPDSVNDAVDQLNQEYNSTGRSFRIERIAAGYRIMTLPDFAPVVAAMHRAKAGTRLTRTQLETLSIIAYRQPVTRAELENIRGVACGDIVRALMDRQLVKITGRAEVLGRPMLYGTAPRFLDTFGLASLKDLPKPEELLGNMEQQP
ncbi:MAG: SMC-Scp complex subunit ScpB [Phycisphaerales bacterium]